VAIEQYQIPKGLLYDSNNYWVKVNEDRALIGITEYGQSTIGDVLYLETASTGMVIEREDEVGSIEAGKWVGKLISPVSGVVEDVNNDLNINPRDINKDPYGQGWLMRVKLNNSEETQLLMDSILYEKWVAEQIRREKEEEAIV